MNQISPSPTSDLVALLENQKTQNLEQGVLSAEQRIDRINRLIDLVADNRQDLCDAISADFGSRSSNESLIADIGGTLTELKHARDHLKEWMKPEKVKTDTPLWLFGGRSRIEYQPLGVIGIVAPWNFPVYLAIGPMGEAFAAGNSVMLKPSEFTPRTSALMKELIETSFSQREVCVVTGDVETGRAFAALPFNHLLFTGATAIGPAILHAAADHMTPVTLELGGKSPVIVTDKADMDLAAARIASGKLFNAGQVCLAPDYVLVPRDRMNSLIDDIAARMTQSFPTLGKNQDYTHIVTDRQLTRLQTLVNDARAKGTRIREINPANEIFDGSNQKIMPPTILIDPDPALDVMQQEIFGPLLPVLPYDNLDEAIAFVNKRPRPLALYAFSKDAAEQQKIIDNTISGGVCLNDTIMHSTQQSLPFGGVGASGTGAYHGIHGFRRFSHARAVYKQINMDAPFKPLRAPFGDKFAKAIAPMLKK